MYAKKSPNLKKRANGRLIILLLVTFHCLMSTVYFLLSPCLPSTFYSLPFSVSILVPGMVWAADPPPGWGTVASGGVVCLGNGVYRLHATAGQPAIVGLGQNSSYRLSSGFWHPAAAPDTPVEPGYPVYLPLVLRE